jgi:MFS family permease
VSGKAPLPRAIWALGFVSLLMDVSSEMIHGLLPVFLVGMLGTSPVLLGLMEGLAEAIPLFMKAFSGALSDRLGNRKWVTVVGYGMSAATKPLFVIATSTGFVMGARMLDRIGKGVRGAPRDALIADLVPPESRAAAYGLRQSLDTVGAVLGPLLAIALMLAWHDDVRAVFTFAVIPAALAVLWLVLGVKEPARSAPQKSKPKLPLRDLGRGFWWVAAIGALFAFARFSEAFLVLRAKDRGLAISLVPLVLVTMNVVYALTAFPFGKLSEKFSARSLLGVGALVLAGSHLLLALDAHWAVTLVGIALWGLQMGITQGVMSALVANQVPEYARGTAFGVFSAVSGLATLLASLGAGALWSHQPTAPFIAGAVAAALTAVVLRASAPPAG